MAGSTYTHGPLDTPSSHGTEFYQLIRKLEYLKPVILELKENAHTYHQTYGIEHPPSSCVPTRHRPDHLKTESNPVVKL